MIPSTAFLQQAATAVAVTVPPWGAAAYKIGLIKDAFTPSPSLVKADVVMADFTDSDPKDLNETTAKFGIDPITGDWLLVLTPPAGGWIWATPDTVNLPQTIYGWCLLNTAGTVLLGSDLIDPPVAVTAALDVVDLGSLVMRLPLIFLQ